MNKTEKQTHRYRPQHGGYQKRRGQAENEGNSGGPKYVYRKRRDSG